jgi:hypothetical protein
MGELVRCTNDGAKPFRRPALDAGLGFLSGTKARKKSQAPCQARGDGEGRRYWLAMTIQSVASAPPASLPRPIPLDARS